MCEWKPEAKLKRMSQTLERVTFHLDMQERWALASKRCTPPRRLEANRVILDLLMRTNYRHVRHDYLHDYVIAILNARKINAIPPFHPDPAGS